MDPNACLQRWREAKADGDRTEARHARADLLGWLRGGGFEPTWENARERSYFIRKAPTHG